MIGEAQYKINVGSKRQSFRVRDHSLSQSLIIQLRAKQIYLISWHHLHAYISRLDISKRYLDDLAYESKKVNEILQVTRCKVFNIKNENERVELAHLIFKMTHLHIKASGT